MDYTGRRYNSLYRAVMQPSSGTVYAGHRRIHDLYQSTT